MKFAKKHSVALVWAQFAAYHTDRCEAVARRLADRADVLAVEVATTSSDYAWERSADVPGARKVTLFPGQSFDEISPLRRYRAMLAAVWRSNFVAIGLSYGEVDAILLSWTLRLLGKRVVVFSETKFDDKQRSIWHELLKCALLSCYSAAIVGAKRHIEYFRFLRFHRRPIIPGYDGVSLERVRRQAGSMLAPGGIAYETRPFVYVGRFVAKKNLEKLIEGYACYLALGGPTARRLVLVGSGDEEAMLRRRCDELDISHLVNFAGFLTAAEVSRTLASSLALMLVSSEEQWGLVVNEALAVGLPVVVSHEVGSRDALVRNLVNGFVVESSSPASIGHAMLLLATDRATWERMVTASHARGWLGDADRIADAIEILLYPEDPAATARIGQFMSELELES